MAYKRSKRFAAKRVRKRFRSYGRRYYRRRSRAGRYIRRRYYRFPRSTEVKIVEGQQAHTWDFDNSLDVDNYTFAPGLRLIVGSTASTEGLFISQGSGVNQRIGMKITPVKLRLCGSLSYDRVPTQTTPAVPEAFQIALTIYQVRGGNIKFSPSNENYHNLALYSASSDSLLGGAEIKKLYNYYQSTAPSTQAPLADRTFTPDQLRQNMGTAKTPFRLGLGGQCKVLYKKTFTLQTGDRTSIPFRIVTKVPNRMVWPETDNGGTGTSISTQPRNAIYALWVVIPQSTKPYGNVNLTYQTQLFFLDR